MNIYSVLDLSDNEEEQPKVAADKKGKDAAKPAAAKKESAVKPAAKATETKGKDAAPASAKPKSATTADKPKSAPASEAVDGDAAGKDDNRGGRARGKEYREKGGRGGRGGAESTADGERRPKRDFERRSGTGRGREVSKGGRGSFGFGNPAQDAQDAEKDPNSAEAPIERVDGAEEPAEPEFVAEPEPVTFTLDEFMEKRNQARKLLATETKVRVVDQSSLAGLNRKEDLGETTYMPVKAGKADASRKDQRSTAKTQVLDVAFKFAAIQVDEERGGRGGGRGGEGRGRAGDGRGRGGRGGASRGDGGRGASRPASGKPAAFNNNDFPSL